jgi:predicted anti-sigma-YlaC factor YlaD
MIHLTMRASALSLVPLVVTFGCSLKTIALTSLADAMSSQGTVYARDDDPDLVRDSLPVLLKTMEQLYDALPHHVGIRLALARSFTSLGVGFVKEDAERLEERDVAAARAIYARCRRLLLRARDYGLSGLDLEVPGLRRALESGKPEEYRAQLQRARLKDVALIYWTAAAWGSAISSGKDNMKLVGELPKVEALMTRALELDEGFDEGSIHDFFVIYDAGRSEAQGGGKKRAKAHLERSLALSKNKRLSPLVSYAEAVSVDDQNKKEFQALLERVLAYDVDADPDHRLVNLLAQRRARWLYDRMGDLFAE